MSAEDGDFRMAFTRDVRTGTVRGNHELDGDVAPSVVEVGPRLAFQSAWSTNAVAICNASAFE